MRPHARPDPETADPARLIGGLVRIGVIDSVDLDAGRAVVRDGDALTPPLDWLAPVGDTALWLPPTVGAQVLFICPEADPAQGVILNGLRSAAHDHLFAGAAVALRFRDGATITYDPAAARLTLDLPGQAVITAADGVRIEGDLRVTGKLHAEDDISSDGDVIADDISLMDHVHGGVGAGSAKTGAAE